MDGHAYYFLHPFIRSHVSGLMQIHDISEASAHQILGKSLKKCKADPGNDSTSTR
jgi:hypothetical protein